MSSRKAKLCSDFRQVEKMGSECNFAKRGKRSSPLYVLKVKVQASLGNCYEGDLKHILSYGSASCF